MQNRSYDLARVLFAYCKSVDTPVSLGVWLRYKYGEHKQLAECAVNPSQYLSAWSFSKDYSVVSLLKKYEGLKTGIDLKAVAIEKWRQSEVKCAATNRYFRVLRFGFPDPDAAIIHIARGKISRVLGDLDVAKIVDRGRWGPGATFSLKRELASVDKKISELPISVTATCLPLARAIIQSDPHWVAALLGLDYTPGPVSLLPCCFSVVKGCRFTTVRKDARSDRTIAVEPGLNGFIQMAVGDYMRDRLKQIARIDLRKQENNQSLAKAAIDSGLATLDLSSASDSVSCELVRELLPPPWFEFLNQIRSQYFALPEGWVRLEKFSSMGNGFTFGLETLIFWALSKACVENCGGGTVSVYGDDIIVPQHASETVIRLLNRCGFSVNIEKSFTEGRFFESCGKHYFDGVDVTPAFQKKMLTSESELVRLHNRLMRMALRFGCGDYLDSVLRPAILAVRDQFTGKLRSSFLPLGMDGDMGPLLTRKEAARIASREIWWLQATTKERQANGVAWLQKTLRDTHRLTSDDADDGSGSACFMHIPPPGDPLVTNGMVSVYKSERFRWVKATNLRVALAGLRLPVEFEAEWV